MFVRPGASRSSGRMFVIRSGRWERREVAIRRRNWVAPSVYFRVSDLLFAMVGWFEEELMVMGAVVMLFGDTYIRSSKRCSSY